MVDAHEQDERFTERDLIAAHAERAESEEFRHLTWPTWFARKARRAGENVTLEEEQLRGEIIG